MLTFQTKTVHDADRTSTFSWDGERVNAGVPCEASMAALDELAVFLSAGSGPNGASSFGELPEARIAFLGGHVIKSGQGANIVKLFKAGVINYLVMNGAAAIHDWELALTGRTSEDTVKAVRDGTFGMGETIWAMNEAVRINCHAKGSLWAQLRHALKHSGPIAPAQSVLLNCECAVIHGVGMDVVCQHANYSARDWAHLSYCDFCSLVNIMPRLKAWLNIGSSVCGVEVFLKALAMTRNAGVGPTGYRTWVFDIDPPADSGQARYFCRPAKTLLDRVSEWDGQGTFIAGDHAATIPYLTRKATRVTP